MTVLDAPALGSVQRPAPAAGLSVVTLTEPLPGFPGYCDYALVPADATGLVHWLQAVDPDGPRFVVVPATPFFPDYSPALPAAVRAELSLADPADARLYCLVTVPDGDVPAATANLRAPLVVNVVARRARQVVLTDGGHPIGAPLRR